VYDLNTRVNALEKNTSGTNVVQQVSAAPDIESIVDKKLNTKFEVLEKKIEDLTKSTVAAIAEVKIAQLQQPSPVAEEQIIIPDIVTANEPATNILSTEPDDDFVIGIKEEKKTTKRSTKKK
jgi:hypothetical protein